MTTADTPQHNGVAEGMNCTLVERVWTILIDAELPDTYWWDALQYAAFLHNVSLTCSLRGCTPEEAWSGNKRDVSCLRIFGCRTYVHIPDKMRHTNRPGTPSNARHAALSIARPVALLSPATLSSKRGVD